MKISGSLGIGSLTPVTTESAAQLVSESPTQKLDDSITVSSTARLRAEAASHPRWGALSARLHAEPDIADQVAYEFSHNVHQPLVNITEMMNGTGPVRYTADRARSFRLCAAAAACPPFLSRSKVSGEALGEAQRAYFRHDRS